LKGRSPFKNYSFSYLKSRVFKRGFTPLFINFPLSFKGEGDKGGEVGK